MAEMCLAVPGKIESIDTADPESPIGKVNFGGIIRTIHLGLVPDASIGDYVMVHAGVAIGILDVGEAEETLNLIRQIESGDEIPG
jgi:hydrogenase expression/formation protein HypC